MTLDFSGITDLPSVYIALAVLGITYGLRFYLVEDFCETKHYSSVMDRPKRIDHGAFVFLHSRPVP